eukprot:CAMPEP_0197035606 /NCGR_PEP_ID=MMETSP1384-20130603/13353_1 /TAXON_ID=29189 /ORGANISM="Ammonia sp." /LENGTH=603 /DNA_ID=CAMNT_0042465685 /DNA_START=36 /DNA_END=1847 /DNA_ORIENTATION=-
MAATDESKPDSSNTIEQTQETVTENNQSAQPAISTATDESCEPSLEDSLQIIQSTNPSLKISSLSHSQQETNISTISASQSQTENNEEDEKDVDGPTQQRKRVHEAAADLTKIADKRGYLKTLAGNFNKRTYCYKMVTDDQAEYFVKIFEDSTTNPTVVPKKLFKDAALRDKLKPYILLPAFKPQKTRLAAHTYEVVIYPFINHLTLEDITLKALKAGYIDPSYHRRRGAKPHAPGYKMRLLQRFEQCVTIAIKLKDDCRGFVDMDLSPDNFIVTTNIADAAENDQVKWDHVTDAAKAECLKIDHESMMEWKETFHRVDKPMKPSFKAPEVNTKSEDDSGEYQAFDVEKANVYQIGATFIYVLYGQIKEISPDGDEYWKSLPPKGNGGWKNTGWNPKYLDLQWLQKCVDRRPQIRPSYDELLREVRFELAKYAGSRSRSNFGGPAHSSRSRARRVNEFHNANGASVPHGNGRDVTILYVPESHVNNGGHVQYVSSNRLRQAAQQQYMQQQQQQHPNVHFVNAFGQVQSPRAPQQQQQAQPRGRRMMPNPPNSFGGNRPSQGMSQLGRAAMRRPGNNGAAPQGFGQRHSNQDRSRRGPNMQRRG